MLKGKTKVIITNLLAVNIKILKNIKRILVISKKNKKHKRKKDTNLIFQKQT